MKTVYLVTTNPNKLAVARTFLASSAYADAFVLEQYDIETPEIQADHEVDVAKFSAVWASAKLGKPVICADAGLQILALGGFPGPYVKYFNEKFTVDQVLTLMAAESDRSATWVDSLAYASPDGQTAAFVSETPGRIAEVASMAEGSTVDRLFIPEGQAVPLADIDSEARAKVWNVKRWEDMFAFLATQ